MTRLWTSNSQMTETPSISVLITAYNYGRFIEEAIDSVLAQDYPTDRIEIVVVDDGSTDDTPVRIQRYGTKIIYLRKANAGQASALNLGFNQARGEIVSLLDADDYFLPHKLRRVAEAFQANPALGMFYHPFHEFDMETSETRTSTFPLVSGSPFEDPGSFLTYAGPGTCVSFRKKIAEPLFPIPEEIRMLADGYLGSLIVFLAPIQAVSECLATYRFHGNNAYHANETQMSTETRKKRIELYKIEFAAMKRWLAQNRYTRRELAVRSFLDSWDLWLEGQDFWTNPPGRARYCRWLWRRNGVEGIRQSRAFTVLNYFAAVAALVAGYQRSSLIYESRDRGIEFFKRLSLRPSSEGSRHS